MPVSLPRWAAELAISLLVAALGGFFLAAGWRLPPPDEAGIPGPGTVPMLLGGVVLIAGLGNATLALIRRDPVRMEIASGKQVIATAGLALGAALFESAGFMLATFLFLLGGFTLLGGADWRRAAPAAALVSAALWFLFTKLLGVGLPYGVIGEILFR